MSALLVCGDDIAITRGRATNMPARLFSQTLGLRQKVRWHCGFAQYFLHPAPPLGCIWIAAFNIRADQVLAPTIIDHIAAIMVGELYRLFRARGREQEIFLR